MAGQSNSKTFKQRPATENPYYVLATIYGEQTGDWINWDLHKKNRQAWNAYFFQNITPDQQSEWLKEHKIDLSDLPDWSDIEADVTARFANRLPETMVPSPDYMVDFRNNIFENPVCFGDFWFTADALFDKATFTGDALFDDARFTGAAWFGAATFTGDAVFRDATFTGDVWFRAATFRGAAIFLGVVFEHYSHFDQVRFGDACDLRNTRFEKPCDFTDAIFETQFPRLNAALLHERTILTASAENWPPRLVGQDPGVARASCAMLRHTVAQQGLPEEEHFFFRLEMAFAVRIAKVKTFSPYFWFGALSEYGYSISRPAAGLLWLWVLGVVILWHFNPGPVTIWEYSTGDWRAFAQSAANIFPYLGFQKAYLGDYMKDAPGWLVGFSMLQTVFGALLLFLIGLGLRTRFRLR